MEQHKRGRRAEPNRNGGKAVDAIASGDAFGHGGPDRSGAARHTDTDDIVVRLDMIENGRDGTRATWGDVNPITTIIGHQRVRYREIARSISIEVNAVEGDMTDHAILDGQRLAGVEINPLQADSSALYGQAAQADGVA